MAAAKAQDGLPMFPRTPWEGFTAGVSQTKTAILGWWPGRNSIGSVEARQGVLWVCVYVFVEAGGGHKVSLYNSSPYRWRVSLSLNLEFADCLGCWGSKPLGPSVCTSLNSVIIGAHHFFRWWDLNSGPQVLYWLSYHPLLLAGH